MKIIDLKKAISNLLKKGELNWYKKLIINKPNCSTERQNTKMEYMDR